MSGRAFGSDEKREAFWTELNELLARYNFTAGWIEHMESLEQDDEDKPFDTSEPVIMQGIVLLMAFRNMSNWESLLTLDPLEQSEYMTIGMLQTALDSQ